MQQSLTSKSTKASSTHGSAAISVSSVSDGIFNHSDEGYKAARSAVDTPIFDELLDLLIPAIECIDCLFSPDGCSTCAGSLAKSREALMSFIGSWFSGVPNYKVKQGIYTYLISSGSSARTRSGHAASSSASVNSDYTAICNDDGESGPAVLNAAIRRIIGFDYCFNTEKRKRPEPYKLVTKSDLRLITISGFKSFNLKM